MKRVLMLILSVLALCIGITACSGMIYGDYDNAGKAPASKNVQALAAQAPGAISALADVAMAAPVDAKTREQIAGYAAWAKLGAETASGVATAMSAKDGVSQAIGAAEAVNKLIQQAPVDAKTKESVGGWADWALIALKAAATIVPLVL